MESPISRVLPASGESALNSNKGVLILGLVTAILYFGLYFFSHFSDGASFSFANLAIFSLSLALIAGGILGIFNNSYCVTSYFLTSYFFVLSLSCVHVSGLQSKYNWDFFYVAVFGGLLFALLLAIFDRIAFPRITSRILIDANLVAAVLILTYIALKYFILSETGTRLATFQDVTKHNGDMYALAGFSGLALVLQSTLLMMFPLIKKHYKFIIIVLVATFAVLHVKRGDVMRLAIFLILYFLITGGYLSYSRLKLKSLGLVLGCAVIVVIGHSYLGNVRQSLYSPDYDIKTIADSRYDSDALSWFFTYTGMNFEVLSRIDLQGLYGYPRSIMLPVDRYVDPDSVQEYYDRMSTENVRGFNASTFLGPMVLDMGRMFWVELMIYCVLALLPLAAAKMCGADGARIFMISMVVLLPFGDHIMQPAYYISMLLSPFLFIFLSKRDEGAAPAHDSLNKAVTT